MLCQTGQLSGAIRIPDTVGQLVVTADLRSSKVACHVDVDAPREGRPTTRVNWLVRQLKAAPDSLRIETFAAHARGSSAAELLGAVREDPAVLVVDPTKEIRSFRLALTLTMGTKRGRGRGSFIDSVLGATDTFYADVLQSSRHGRRHRRSSGSQDLARPTPRPTTPRSLASTDYSSQDGVGSVDDPTSVARDVEPPSSFGTNSRQNADAVDGDGGAVADVSSAPTHTDPTNGRS